MIETSLATTNYSKYGNLGMKNISGEDIRPPVAFLVQGIKNKSELKDASGKECPEGSFFLKGVNEIFQSKEVYFVWIKKDHFKMKPDAPASDEKWLGSRVFTAVAVRADDFTPFAIKFQKSSQGGVNDLLTAKTSKKLPLFVFKCELKSVLTTNKAGNDYFKSAIVVKGVEENQAILDDLFDLAKGFDNQEEVPTDEEEVAEKEPTISPTPEEENQAAEVADDVPF